MAGLISNASTTTCALFLLLHLAIIFFYLALTPAVSLSFNYSTFSSADQNNIKIEGDASFSVGWIDISANRFGSIDNSTGRASYNLPMLLWDTSTGEVASFTTRFSFAISGDVNSEGQGMAFFLAAYPSSLPERCADFNLGLTNQSADAVASGNSRFVAVEFDTFDPSQTYDHISIDANSILSVATQTLPSFELTDNLTAAILYDNVSSILSVTLWVGDDRSGQPRGRNYSLSSKVDLKNALPEQVSVGFSASTSNAVELHQLRSWSFSSSLEPRASPPPPPSSPSSSRGPGLGVIAGAVVGATVILVLLITAAVMARIVRRRRRCQKIMETEEYYTDSDGGSAGPMAELEMGRGPRRFPYHELVEATRSFAAEEKLGQGGFGSVYRGYLREPAGLAVAIKRFSKHESSMQGKREYKSEINVISRLRHRNLVQLIGWCHARDELLLVYELMPNRSLDIHLHGKGTFLAWPTRMKIVLELGSALLYLHEEWQQCVLHRDIKPSNVMLDESFVAKLGDFGLARLVDHATGMQTMTAVSGTPGYLDPHCIVTGRASAESDVYSFGVVLLEVASGRKPMSIIMADQDQQQNGGVFRLLEWVWGLYGRGAILEATDERLNNNYSATEVEKVMVVGLWCAHPDPSARPSIREAMATLHSKFDELPALPSRMPVPTYASPPLALGSDVGLSSLTSSSYSHYKTVAVLGHNKVPL